MANQHNNGDPIYERCAEPSCTHTVRRTPSEVRLGQHKYCTQACAHKRSLLPRKWGPVEIAFIMQFRKHLSVEQFANHFNATIPAIKKLFCNLRAIGHLIPKGKGGSDKKHIIGSTRTRRDRGRQYTQVLTDKGWRAKAKEITVRQHTERKPAGNKVTSAISRAPILREEPKKSKSSPVKSICVVINSKTQVYVSNLADIPKVRQKYEYLNQSIYAV